MSQSPAITPGRTAPAEMRAAPVEPRPTADRLPARLAGTSTGWAMRLTYLVADVAAISLALSAAHLAACLLQTWPLTPSLLHLKLYGLLASGLLAAALSGRTYAAIPPRPVRQFRSWVLGAAAVAALSIAVLMLLGVGTALDHTVLAGAALIAVPLASFFRAVCRIAFGKTTWWGTRLLVIGSGPITDKALAAMEREPQWGLRAAGYVADLTEADASGSPGLLQRLDVLAAELGVSHALLAVDPFDSEELAALFARSSRIQHWIILPPLAQFPSLWLEECEAARLPALTVTNRLALPLSRFCKRALDLAIAIAAGGLALPLIGLIWLAVRLTSPGPVFYGHERIGRHGRRFRAWKFRTMFEDADALLARHLQDHPDLAAQWAAKHKLLRDPRVTGVGRWLRLTSLDELPQIWNVITGQMSVVGPRPIVAAEIDKYADRYEDYVKVLPGITGLWQVSGRNNTTYEERIDLDVYYVRNWSLWLDVYIVACTVKVVLLGEGAY